MALALKATYPSQDAFRVAWDTEISRGGLLVRGAEVPQVQVGTEVVLTLVVGHDAVQVPARVATIIPGLGVAVLFEGVPEALAGLAMPVVEADLEEKEAPDTSRQPQALSERLRAMTVNEKMQLALSGQRDERAAILRDTNKMLHLFVFKNPRIGLDEVQSAAKNAQLSPEAIKFIAEHREWGSNPMVCTALVRNPKTPLPLALKMIDRLPMTELRTLAKGGAREAVVHAARKKVIG